MSKTFTQVINEVLDLEDAMGPMDALSVATYVFMRTTLLNKETTRVAVQEHQTQLVQEFQNIKMDKQREATNVLTPVITSSTPEEINKSMDAQPQPAPQSQFEFQQNWLKMYKPAQKATESVENIFKVQPDGPSEYGNRARVLEEQLAEAGTPPSEALQELSGRGHTPMEVQVAPKLSDAWQEISEIEQKMFELELKK